MTPTQRSPWEYEPWAPARDLALQCGLGFVLVFATLAFAAVQTWAWALLLGVALGLLAFRTDPMLRHRRLVVERAPLLLGLALVGAVLVVQLIPLPPFLVEALAPKTHALLSERLPGFARGAWQPLSLDRSATIETGLKLLLYAATFLLAAGLARAGKGEFLLYVLVGLAAFEAVYGLAEAYAAKSRIFLWRKPFNSMRASGTYINPNHLAGLLGMAIPIALGLAALPSRRPKPPRGTQWLVVLLTHPELPKRVLLVFACLAAAAGLVGSLSRAGVVAAVCGVIALALLYPNRRRGRWLVLGVVGAALVWVALLGTERLMHRFQVLSEAQGPGTATRLDFARDTLRMSTAHPLLGVGGGAFEATVPEYLRVELPEGKQLKYAHNDYAQTLAELGWGGAAALFLGVFLTWWRARKVGNRAPSTRRRALVAMSLAALVPLMVHSLVDFNLRMPANALWATALLGFAWGTARPRTVWKLKLRGTGSERRRRRALVGVGLGVLAAFGVFYGWVDWVARPRIERTQRDPRPPAMRRGTLERAVRLWPFRADLLEELAAVRWMAAREEHLLVGERAARELLKGMHPTPQELRYLARGVATARLRVDPQAGAEMEACLGLLDRARRLSPPSPGGRRVRRWLDRERQKLEVKATR